MHPGWMLAAWSVSKNGIVSGDREGAKALVESVISTGYGVIIYLHCVVAARGLF